MLTIVAYLNEFSILIGMIYQQYLIAPQSKCSGCIAPYIQLQSIVVIIIDIKSIFTK